MSDQRKPKQGSLQDQVARLREALSDDAPPKAPVKNPFKKQVLIVDDNEALSQLLGSTLGGGFETNLCLLGNDAIAKIESNPFDLIVLDLNLPDISGLQVLETAKKLQPKAIVVVITGEPPASHKYQQALFLGAVAVLPKPLPSPTELRAILGKHLFFTAQK